MKLIHYAYVRGFIRNSSSITFQSLILMKKNEGSNFDQFLILNNFKGSM